MPSGFSTQPRMRRWASEETTPPDPVRLGSPDRRCCGGCGGFRGGWVAGKLAGDKAMRFTRFAKGRKSVRGEKNKTELRYEEFLGLRKLAGEIQEFAYEPIRLRLAADNAFYAPDFGVLAADDVYECHEVKAGRVTDAGTLVPLEEEAARVRRKVAAEQHPFRFVLAIERPKKAGGGFETRIANA